jgi:hypothetical protein
MSTTEDTSAIDEKKAEESGTSTTSPDFKSFAQNYTYSLIISIGIGIFVIGTLGLFTTKVVQANILPDNIELAPYTVIDRIVEEIPIDINIMKPITIIPPSFFPDSEKCFSQKAIFKSKEYLDSFNNGFLCSIKNSADPNAGLFANGSLYFSKVYDNIVSKNFLIINTVFFYLSYLPESLIMLLYGIFGIFLWMLLYFVNLFLSIYFHFVNIPQLFRSTSEQNDKQWESIENISLFRFMKLILFFFVWSWIAFFSALITPAFFTLYGLISPLFASYKINDTEGSYGLGNFLWSTIWYKQFFFFILATVSLFSNGIKNLGTNAIVAISIAVLFAFFMGLYANNMPEVGTYGFTAGIKETIKQAAVDSNKKILVEICSRIPMDDEKIEEIIKNGKFRQLTKPTTSGGEGNVKKSIEMKQFKTKFKDEAEKITNDFEKFDPEIRDSKEGRNIQERLEKIGEKIGEMKGGKKIKNHSVKPNKKYNIRWT